MTTIQRQKEPVQTRTTSKSSLDGIRLAAEDLYSAISDAAVLRHEHAKVRLVSVAPKPAVIVAAIRAVLAAHTELAQNHLTEAVVLLEETEAQLTVSAKTTGVAFHTAVRQALANSRSAVRKVGAVVASTRWT